MISFFEKIQELIQQFAWEWGFIDLEVVVDLNGYVDLEWLSFLAYQDLTENPELEMFASPVRFTGEWRFA